MSRTPAGLSPDEELLALLGEQRGELVSVEPLSRLAAPRHRGGAWRLHLRDGGSVKARCLRDAATAERVAGLLAELRHPAFPRLLARRGRGLLLEWIEGRPLDASPPDSVLRACARLQVELHRTHVSESRALRSGSAFVDAQLERSERHLERLRETRSLAPGEVDELRRRLAAHRPADAEVGVVHGDFCGENLVLDAAGAPRPVDNEALAVGAVDGDLARTLWRWPLGPDCAARYLEHYAAMRDLDEFRECFPFWALAVRLGSAAHRLGAASGVADPPLAALRTMLRLLERAAAPGRLVLESCSGGGDRVG